MSATLWALVQGHPFVAALLVFDLVMMLAVVWGMLSAPRIEEMDTEEWPVFEEDEPRTVRYRRPARCSRHHCERDASGYCGRCHQEMYP